MKHVLLAANIGGVERNGEVKMFHVEHFPNLDLGIRHLYRSSDLICY